MVILALELEFHEPHSKIIELPHLIRVDQTSKSPVQSMSGQNYLMVLCAYDENAMLAEPIRYRKP